METYIFFRVYNLLSDWRKSISKSTSGDQKLSLTLTADLSKLTLSLKLFLQSALLRTMVLTKDDLLKHCMRPAPDYSCNVNDSLLSCCQMHKSSPSKVDGIHPTVCENHRERGASLLPLTPYRHPCCQASTARPTLEFSHQHEDTFVEHCHSFCISYLLYSSNAVLLLKQRLSFDVICQIDCQVDSQAAQCPRPTDPEIEAPVVTHVQCLCYIFMACFKSSTKKPFLLFFNWWQACLCSFQLVKQAVANVLVHP